MGDIFDEVERNLNRKKNGCFFAAQAIILAVLLLIIAVPVGLSTWISQGHRTDYQITIDSKDHPCMSGSHCKYMIYATDGTVYENRDQLVWGWRWKTDSANMQARFKIGHTYHIRVVGYRNSFFSWFENIIYAEEVPTNGPA